MAKSLACSKCGEAVSKKDLLCRGCGLRIRYKTFKEAYSWGGLGLFDLIPGIRDLPYAARFAIMAIVIVTLVLLIVPVVVRSIMQ